MNSTLFENLLKKLKNFKIMLDFVVFPSYIKVLIEVVKRWFGEFFKNLSGTRIKSHCWVLGIIPPVVFPSGVPKTSDRKGLKCQI